MRALWTVVVAASACYSPSAPTGAPCVDDEACPAGQACIEGFCGGSASSDDAATDMAEVDAVPIDAPLLCTTWTAEHIAPCTLPAPTGDLTLTQAGSPYDWNTDTGVLRAKGNVTIAVPTMVITQTGGGPDVLVASVSNLTVATNAKLTTSGARPLLIATWDTATIAGEIDVSASFTAEGAGGAGTANSFCDFTPTGNGGAAGTPATGGGGGAFGGSGGRGGNTTGAGIALPTPTIIRGGCAGGVGGGSTVATNATRGAGGGAIEIAARTSITVSFGGAIEASGGAGRGGGAAYGAGGGGGAGGYIGLDAPSVMISGTVTANGGSGGGGASDVDVGANGVGGLRSSLPAVGGAGAATSGVGTCVKAGNGSGGVTLGGTNAGASPCGGGGGGGGAGYVLIWAPTPAISGTVSPPFIAGP